MKTNTIAASVLLMALLPAAAMLSPACAQSPAPASLPAKTGPASANDAVSLNFVNADIDQVIAAIGMISGRNFLIDPRVKGTLNIVSAKPVPRELTYQILLSSLRLQGYAAVEANGVTTILPESDAKLHGSQVNVVGSTVGRPAVRSSGNRLITQVYPLKHESAAQLVPILRPLIAPNNTIAAYANSNTLVITDYAENVARLTKIIDAVDQAQDDVVVVPIVHGSAVDLAATLNRLFGDGTGATTTAVGGDASQRFSALAEYRSNHVLIRSGNASKIAGARQLLASLDVAGAAGNIHVVYLKNAEATKVAQTLRAVMSGDTSTPTPPTGSAAAATSMQNQAQTASGGIVQADAASNALIITAPDATYNNLRRVIDQLDRRRAQVFVEALIAEVSAERAAEFGIQWQSTKGIGSAGNPKLFGGTNFGAQPGQNIISTAFDPSSVGKGLNLMVTEGTLSIPGIGEITNLGLLARLLESDAKTNILSTPNLVTLDNEEAKIVIGQNVPFVTGQFTSTAGTATNPFQTIERKDVGLMLKIKPQISEGGTIKLLISQEASSVTTNSDAGLVTNKRSLDSTVLVDDGAIIALGGLIQDSYESGVEKVPLLGDIPFLGALFRYDTRKRTRTNLVIFLRPQILRDRSDYSGLTQSRYDFVVGEQTRLDPPGRLMKDEPPGPVLPELLTPASTPAKSSSVESSSVESAPVESAPVEQSSPAPAAE